MSSIRRIVVAGLPTAGLTLFSALALSGAPATAATMSARAISPIVKTTPCADSARGACGYGVATTPPGTLPTGGATTPATVPTTGTTPAGTTPATVAPATTPATVAPAGTPSPGTPTTGTTTTPTGSPVTAAAVTPTRGGPSYGGTSPTGGADTVPAGVSPSAVSPAHAASPTPGGGVSAGHALPVTGAPTGSMVSLGGMFVAAGAAALWYTRRRRTA